MLSYRGHVVNKCDRIGHPLKMQFSSKRLKLSKKSFSKFRVADYHD